MAVESELLNDISRQIEEYFTGHKNISVVPVKGNPPDQYEITYSLPGMAVLKGEITEASSHIIEFSIPFGFPHFPPSCKPKSDIFHPDFDPAAICLGDFWEENNSLPELIIHIGRMICGEFYSTDNAFNEDAASWFIAHQDELPFSTILDNELPTLGDSENQPSIDTLDDSDLLTDFDYLADDQNEPESEFSFDDALTAEEPEDEIDISLLRLLEEQKNFFQLLETIGDTPSISTEVRQFQENAQAAIDSANIYHKNAKREEKSGNTKAALAEYKKTENSAADFPDIAANIARAKRSLDLFSDNNTPKELQNKKKSSSRRKKKSVAAAVQTPKTGKPARETRSLKIGLKILAISISILLIGGAGTAGFLYFNAQDKISAAGQALLGCQSQLLAKKFRAAKRSCDTAAKLASAVLFFHTPQKELLVQQILKVVSSKEMTMGLAGKVLINGEYLPKADAEIITVFQQLSSDAAQLFEQSLWQEASLKLQEAIDIASKNNTLIDADKRSTQINKLHQSKLQLYLNAGAKKQSEKAWKPAIKIYSEALLYLKEIDQSLQQQYRMKLQQNLERSRFEDLKHEADTLFAESDWQNARSFYQRVLSLGQTSDEVSPESLAAVSINIERAKLYAAISKGNLAFSSGSWQEAIDAFRAAQTLIASNSKLLSQSDSEINIKKLAKIILQASIIKNKQSANKYIEENDLQAAKTNHQQVINDINSSEFKNTKDYMEIIAESSEIIQSLKTEIYLSEKRQYLETNFQKLFNANYPVASAENLTNPVVSFIKESPEKLLYKLQCTEIGRGRPLSLIMYYAYDKKSDTWSFSSGSL